MGCIPTQDQSQSLGDGPIFALRAILARGHFPLQLAVTRIRSLQLQGQNTSNNRRGTFGSALDQPHKRAQVVPSTSVADQLSIAAWTRHMLEAFLSVHASVSWSQYSIAFQCPRHALHTIVERQAATAEIIFSRQ